ncbi:PAS domain S-box-containing protein [Geomicrobium halophilum]|uniref:HTH-type transcriptional regulatory protein TyrR n=1 Tax=Geomicrobium halophilum TaxID=549000 RepID=A0A841PR24_9BACL|nr:sigma 54-interacting transcriptional regulator [Geomicrobium halophilum]MBB6448741.1 PAS domain S-box-containing protein [Geomicrobium halophilum]
MMDQEYGFVGKKKPSNEPQYYSKLLDSIIQSSYDGIYVADAYGIGWTVNDAYTRITGVRKEELINRDLRSVVNEGIISESVTFKVLKEKKSVTIIQKVKDTEILATGSPVWDDRGAITHVVTNIRDLSDLNFLMEELNTSRAFTEKILAEVDELRQVENTKWLLNGVIAQSKETMKAVSVSQKVAKVDSTVILTGESGVGKEVFANIIHLGSHRADKPHIKVNCGAIPAQLLESELFGYEKGSFTGAEKTGKAGLFEKANEGTIFLDEVGDIPLDLQVKLLRVLQEFEVVRVGGYQPKPIDVRVVAATNRNLEEQVQKGEFREDLFYRLNIVPIHIPSLRERTADIAPLMYYFLNNVNKKYELNKRFQAGVISALESYQWPGNIREMKNVIERVAVTTDHDEIDIYDFPDQFIDNFDPKDQRKKTSYKNKGLKEAIMDVEQEMIKSKIQQGKTTRKAADDLGISQSSLVKKMKKYQLSVDAYIHE